MKLTSLLPLAFLFVVPVARPARGGPYAPYVWKALYGTRQTLDQPEAMALRGSLLYVTGTASPSGEHDDYVTLRYDRSVGTAVWVRSYDGPAGGADQAKAMAVDFLGNVFVTGRSDGGASTGNDFATVKYDLSSNEIWVRRYNGRASGDDGATAIAVDSGAPGEIYVTGSSEGVGTGSDWATLKYDVNGNEVWVQRFDGVDHGHDKPTALVLGSGVVTVTGISWTLNPSEPSIVTVQYSTADGSLLWGDGHKILTNGSFDSPAGIAEDESSRSVYVAGTSVGQGASNDIVLLGYPEGGGKWVKRYDGLASAGHAVAAAIAMRGDAIYVTGYSDGLGTDNDLVLLKYDRNDASSGYGKEVWVQRYDGPQHSYDIGHALAIDANGSIHVAGDTVGAMNYDLLTLKYLPSGLQLAARCHGSGVKSTWEWARDIVADGLGNTYVTAAKMFYTLDDDSGLPDLSDMDYLTLKYSSSSDKYRSSAEFHKVVSKAGRPIEFADPVEMEGSLELEASDLEAFPGQQVLGVISMELRAASGETLRLGYPPDPVLPMTGGLIPGSFFLASRRDPSIQAWVVLDGEQAGLDPGYQGLCLVPQPDFPDGVYSGDAESPSSFEFTRSALPRGYPPGLGVYQYRVRCPRTGGTAGCEVDLKLHGILSLRARRIPAPPAPPTCVRPSDYYFEPLKDLEQVVLGPVTVSAAVDASGSTRPLEIADTDGDALLDLFVPWSRGDAAAPAAFDFRQVCAPSLPISVEIRFTTLGDDVLWEALRAGVVVDSHVSIVDPLAQTVTLAAASGIDTVWIREGFDVSIHEICWQCPPLAPTCEVSELTVEAGEEAIRGFAKLEGDLDRSDRAGPAQVLLLEADGEPVDIEGRVETEVSDLDPFFYFRIRGSCSELLPDGEGTLWVQARCAGGLIASASAPVRCPGGLPRFERGDCNGDRRHDISDAVQFLGFLFLDTQRPPCMEACDVDGDGALDISDATVQLCRLFCLEARPLVPPLPGCGPNPGGRAGIGCERGTCE